MATKRVEEKTGNNENHRWNSLFETSWRLVLSWWYGSDKHQTSFF